MTFATIRLKKGISVSDSEPRPYKKSVPIKIGDRSHDLTVVKFAGSFKKQRYWVCICICGKPSLVPSAAFRKRKSCGCIKRRKSPDSAKHLMWEKPEYFAWKSMKSRCFNPKHPSFKWYGARGITVCAPWAQSFEKFYFDLGPRPNSDYSLGRINNDGNYEPGNVRWMSDFDQKRHMGNNKFFTLNGERKILPDWAAQRKIPVNTLRSRIKRGISLEQALIPTCKRD